ncbi:restriction endonuclease subunit S [Tenacibaculum piscium]|uniref:restriction endonuclease subunit S n=1 Tax=Tenacibaculum piscium TaxID=1458515 RepID=UPI001F1C4A8D|nr:restriction endonuclease subunit S [Tenacibaculum piscium]
MEKYKKYKNSDIKWLGDIPEHWEAIRFKDFTKIIKDGTHFTPNYTNNGVHFLSVNDITRNPFDLRKSKFISIEEHKILTKRCKPQRGDILLSKNGTIGIPFLIDFDTEVSIYVSLCLLRLTKQIDNSFFYYLLLSEFMFEQYKINSKTNSVSNLHLDKLANFYSIVPPLKEQTEIANYLDAKTQTIDKKVKLLSEKISTYKDYRKTLINQTVTKGLDKNVKLKNSGINWIGEIPKHWEVKRLKDFSVISTGDKNSEDFDYDGMYPFFVRSPEIKKINSYSFDEEAVLTAGDGDVGKVFHYINGKFDVHQRVYCIRCFKKELNAKYFYYYLYSKFYNQAMINNSNSIVNSIRLPLLRNFEIVISNDLKEQQAIANYLDAKTQTIDTIIKNIEKQITTLKELRKTLINEVVTGNVKITE